MINIRKNFLTVYFNNVKILKETKRKLIEQICFLENKKKILEKKISENEYGLNLDPTVPVSKNGKECYYQSKKYIMKEQESLETIKRQCTNAVKLINKNIQIFQEIQYYRKYFINLPFRIIIEIISFYEYEVEKKREVSMIDFFGYFSLDNQRKIFQIFAFFPYLALSFKMIYSKIPKGIKNLFLYYTIEEEMNLKPVKTINKLKSLERLTIFREEVSTYINRIKPFLIFNEIQALKNLKFLKIDDFKFYHVEEEKKKITFTLPKLKTIELVSTDEGEVELKYFQNVLKIAPNLNKILLRKFNNINNQIISEILKIPKLIKLEFCRSEISIKIEKFINILFRNNKIKELILYKNNFNSIRVCEKDEKKIMNSQFIKDLSEYSEITCFKHFIGIEYINIDDVDIFHFDYFSYKFAKYNKNLKVLYLRIDVWKRIELSEYELKFQAPHFQNLEKLEVSSRNNPSLKFFIVTLIIKDLKKLKKIKIKVKCVNRGIKDLRIINCPNVNELSIKSIKFKENSNFLKDLKKLDKLEVLEIINCPIPLGFPINKSLKLLNIRYVAVHPKNYKIKTLKKYFTDNEPNYEFKGTFLLNFEKNEIEKFSIDLNIYNLIADFFPNSKSFIFNVLLWLNNNSIEYLLNNPKILTKTMNLYKKDPLNDNNMIENIIRENEGRLIPLEYIQDFLLKQSINQIQLYSYRVKKLKKYSNFILKSGSMFKSFNEINNIFKDYYKSIGTDKLIENQINSTSMMKDMNSGFNLFLQKMINSLFKSLPFEVKKNIFSFIKK